MRKVVIKVRNVPTDLHRGSSLEVTSVVGQQAFEVESVSQHFSEVVGVGAQQDSEATDAGEQHAESASLINLISLVMSFPSIIFDL